MISAIRQFSQVRRIRLLADGFYGSSKAFGKEEAESKEKPFLTRWNSLIERTGISTRNRRNLELLMIGSILISAVLFATLGRAFVFLLPTVSALFVYTYCRSKESARARAFDRDYPTFLTTLSSTVRTGMDPRIAFNEAIRLFPHASPLYIETKRMVDAWSGGDDDVVAIAKFANSVKHPDVELLRSATRLALAHGTSFSECLHRLARVTRARQSFRRKVRAALAMQRLSAIGIGLSAACIAGLQIATNRAGLSATMEHPTGRVFLCLGVAFVVIGIVWMTRIGLKAE